ncbi:MAG: hypothetical protein ACI4U5_01600 [Bacilli bacterium]
MLSFTEDKNSCIKVELNQLDEYFMDDEPLSIFIDLPYKEIKNVILDYVRLNPYKDITLYVKRSEIVAYHIETEEVDLPKRLLDPHSVGPKRKPKKKEKIDIKERIRMAYTSAFPFLANLNKRKIDAYLEGEYQLDKYELLSVCIALKLDLESVENVLFFSGYGFIKFLYKDRLMRALIEQQKYDIYTVEESVYASNKI